MVQLQRVPGPRPPFAGHEAALAAIVAVGLLAVVAKPWAAQPGAAVQTRPSMAPTKAVATPAAADEGYRFDARLYGPFEPVPEWSLWPAGYFVSVQYVTRAPDDVPRLAPSGAAPSPAPNVGRPPDAPARDREDVPGWPAEVEVRPGDHLLWLGINTPRGWSVERTMLRRTLAGGPAVDVPIRRLPSLWDDHFAVIALPNGPSSDLLAEWPTGTYRLEITVSPGNLTRTVVVRVRTSTDPLDTRRPAPLARQRQLRSGSRAMS